MAGISDKVQIGQSADFLEGVAVDTSAGNGLFREGVVVSDPETAEARQRVTNTTPLADDFGAVVRVAGSIDTGLVQPTTPSDTQPISALGLPLPDGAATAAKQLPDNHQVQVSNFPASFGASQQGAWTVSVDNFPLSFGASQVGAWSVGRTWALDFATDSVDVTGSSVAVANFPSAFGASQVGSWTVSVDNFPAVQPISATSLPLPTGAAIEAKQLPDNHQVTVSNFPLVQAVDTGLGQPLTDAQLRSAPVSVDTGLTQPTTPADTQPVSVASLPLPTGAAIEAKQLPDNHQVQVSNFPAEYPLPAAQVAALTPQTDALTEAQLRTVVPDETGTWSYYAGAAGSVSVAGRVLQITATAGLVAGSLTINGGATISVPAGKSITIEPRANLSSPTVVFTGTQAYFIEVVA